jgi:hypothetical protein
MRFSLFSHSSVVLYPSCSLRSTVFRDNFIKKSSQHLKDDSRPLRCRWSEAEKWLDESGRKRYGEVMSKLPITHGETKISVRCVNCSTIAPSKRPNTSMSDQPQTGPTASTGYGQSSRAHSTSACGQKRTLNVGLSGFDEGAVRCILTPCYVFIL